VGVRLKKSAHTVYKTQYHIVWVSRYRRKILIRGVREYLRTKFEEVRKYHPDWEYVSIGIDVDRVHLHMVIPPKYAVSNAVEIIKSNTSRALKEKFGFLRKVYWDDGGIWGVGYFVSTVGLNEAVIKRYVELQGKEEAGQAELEL
jgi:putative transposase